MTRFIAAALLCAAVCSAACGLKPSATTTVTGPATIALGTSAQYAAVAVPLASSPTSVSGLTEFYWTSSDPARATVTQQGVVTAVGAGRVTISAAVVSRSVLSAGHLEVTVVQ